MKKPTARAAASTVAGRRERDVPRRERGLPFGFGREELLRQSRHRLGEAFLLGLESGVFRDAFGEHAVLAHPKSGLAQEMVFAVVGVLGGTALLGGER